MTKELETVRGSGNVFADLGLADADVEQTKALLAAEIIHILDEEGLSVRAAGQRTGVAYTDFSRIRNVDIDRFTIDRLMKILGRFDRRVDVQLTVSQDSGEDAISLGLKLVESGDSLIIMLRLVLFLVTLCAWAIRALFLSRSELLAENLALRQQVCAFKREWPRPPLDDVDRAFWVALRAFWPGWAGRLIIVDPDTVAKWARERYLVVKSVGGAMSAIHALSDPLIQPAWSPRF